MVLNYIWLFFFIIGFIVALIKVIFFADYQIFADLVNSTFKMAESSVSISIYLIGVMTLWLGFMKIGENGGAVQALSRLFSPFFRKIFPEVPDKHPAMGAMVMNFCANMLGLDNAATPMGLKAMDELQKLNPKKDTASNAQIMFLVLNTSALTIIPVSIMGLRAAYNAQNPADIFLPILITTFFSTLVGLISVSAYQRIKLLNKVVLLYLGSVVAFIAGLIWFLSNLTQPQIEKFSIFSGNFVLYSIIVIFMIMAFRKKVNVYESFIDGAKEGFQVAVKIIPFLVAMLVAIGVFRASGALDYIEDGFRWMFASLGLPTDFVPAIPTGIMKPLSGSGARGMMVEVLETYGVDSFAGRLASTFQGSTETTFYTVAVYYGAVGIKKTRYTIGCGLLADFTAIVAGIFVAYLFFA